MFNPSSVRFGSPALPVIAASSPKAFFGAGILDESRSEVVVACGGTGFGRFIQELLSDYQLGLSRVATPDGRILGGLVFVGKGKVLFLAFDAHSPANRKILLDWKKNKSIQICIKSDIGEMAFASELTNSIVDKLLAVKTDKYEKYPADEMFVVMKALTDFYGSSSQFVMTFMVPCDEQGVVKVRG